jgi:CubicO group peptidase (beta-lactamase class C family)
VTRTVDVGALRRAARAEIAGGLASCQFAVGRDGDVVAFESFGAATDETRFAVASATKPIVASATWHLIGEGLLDVDEKVVSYVPEFGTHGKGAVTVEQVCLMTAGVPTAPMAPAEGADPVRRRARFEQWELEHEPGTRYVYHPTSAHWVLADLLERLSGTDFRDYVDARVTGPLGLPRVLGIPAGQHAGIAQLDTPVPDPLHDGRAAMIEAGVPGAGGVMTAATLARFYQGLLHNPGGLWNAEVLADATGHVRCTLPDPVMGMPANRTLGVVIGNGFGTTWGSSATAFGWPGAGGQVGFAEPATGISFAFLQAGDTDQLRTFGRAARMSSLALELA